VPRENYVSKKKKKKRTIVNVHLLRADTRLGVIGDIWIVVKWQNIILYDCRWQLAYTKYKIVHLSREIKTEFVLNVSDNYITRQYNNKINSLKTSKFQDHFFFLTALEHPKRFSLRVIDLNFFQSLLTYKWSLYPFECSGDRIGLRQHLTFNTNVWGLVSWKVISF